MNLIEATEGNLIEATLDEVVIGNIDVLEMSNKTASTPEQRHQQQ